MLKLTNCFCIGLHGSNSAAHSVQQASIPTCCECGVIGRHITTRVCSLCLGSGLSALKTHALCSCLCCWNSCLRTLLWMLSTGYAAWGLRRALVCLLLICCWNERSSCCCVLFNLSMWHVRSWCAAACACSSLGCVVSKYWILQPCSRIQSSAVRVSRICRCWDWYCLSVMGLFMHVFSTDQTMLCKKWRKTRS